MSAAGRGPRLGGPDDFYATPAYCVDRLLEAVQLPGVYWIEPSAGDGAIIRAVNARRSDVSWFAIEIREEARDRLSESLSPGSSVTIADYLQPFPSPEPCVVIGNPPYSLAREFIERTFERSQGAYVAFLLRLNFAASEKRSELMRQQPPDVYVLPNRPSFCNGKTDATEYAWFVWPPGSPRSAGTFQVLAKTDKAERRVTK